MPDCSVDKGLLGGFGRRLRDGVVRQDGERVMCRRDGAIEHLLPGFFHLLWGPGDALLKPLGGEPDFDLVLWVLGGSRQPRQLSMCRVRELAKGGDQRQVVV